MLTRQMIREWYEGVALMSLGWTTPRIPRRGFVAIRAPNAGRCPMPGRLIDRESGCSVWFDVCRGSRTGILNTQDLAGTPLGAEPEHAEAGAVDEKRRVDA